MPLQLMRLVIVLSVVFLSHNAYAVRLSVMFVNLLETNMS